MKRTLSLALTAMILLTACTQPPPSTPEPTQPSTSQTTSISQTSTSQPDTKTLSMEEYLKDNAISATEENIAEMFKLIDTEQYDIYFTGEAHGMRNTFIFKFELLKYLHQNAGVRYFIEENGYGSVEYLNLYLKTGDENILHNYIIDTSGTGGYSNEHFDFYKNIYEFNQTVPKEDRIYPIGLDIEHVFATPVRYLQAILPDKAAPKEIDATVKQIKTYTEFPTLSSDLATRTMNFRKEIVETVVENFNQNKEVYKNYLGEKYGTYAFTMNNLEKTYDAYVIQGTAVENKFFNMREEQIYQNFKAIYPTLHTSKIYGHWGAAHTRLYNDMGAPAYGTTAFLFRSILQNDIKREKVCSIDLLNIGGKALDHFNNYTEGPVFGTGILLGDEQKLLDQVITDDYGFIRLNGKDSPFAQSKAWIRQSTVEVDAVTTDLYSYIYVLKNSPAATKYTPKK